MLPGAKGIAILKHFESCILKPYQKRGDKPTTGWGNTYYPDGVAVTMHDKPITQFQADKMLEIMLEKLSRQISGSLLVKVSQNQFDALLSFTWNEGIGNFQESTLLKKVNANPNDPTIWGEFLKWIESDNEANKLGLFRRRNSEAHLYFKNEINFYPNLQFNIKTA